MDTTEKFLSRASPEPLSGCWLWTGGYGGNGYPTMYHPRVKGAYKVSRFSYETFNGPLSAKEVVRHVCNNPACVNPGHLIKGTQRQNVLDAVESNRMCPKLADEDVRGILRDYEPNVFGMQRLANKYGCSKRNILDILKGRKFKHITDPEYVK